MTFEMNVQDRRVLRRHAVLASLSKSIPAVNAKPFFIESEYLKAQIPQLYEYYFHREGEKKMKTGIREYEVSNTEIVTVNLPAKIAEQYYWLQHRFGRPWLINTLLNIYEDRQQVLIRRNNAAIDGTSGNYRYPFEECDWPYTMMKDPLSQEFKAYYIDACYPLIDTFKDYINLMELK